MTPERICPVPMVWEKVRTALAAGRAAAAPNAPAVPVPLILTAWNFSSDDEKRRRWAETVEWAEAHGLTDLIPAIEASDWYCGD